MMPRDNRDKLIRILLFASLMLEFKASTFSFIPPLPPFFVSHDGRLHYRLFFNSTESTLIGVTQQEIFNSLAHFFVLKIEPPTVQVQYTAPYSSWLRQC